MSPVGVVTCLRRRLPFLLLLPTPDTWPSITRRQAAIVALCVISPAFVLCGRPDSLSRRELVTHGFHANLTLGGNGGTPPSTTLSFSSGLLRPGPPRLLSSPLSALLVLTWWALPDVQMPNSCLMIHRPWAFTHFFCATVLAGLSVTFWPCFIAPVRCRNCDPYGEPWRLYWLSVTIEIRLEFAGGWK